MEFPTNPGNQPSALLGFSSHETLGSTTHHYELRLTLNVLYIYSLTIVRHDLTIRTNLHIFDYQVAALFRYVTLPWISLACTFWKKNQTFINQYVAMSIGMSTHD